MKNNFCPCLTTKLNNAAPSTSAVPNREQILNDIQYLCNMNIYEFRDALEHSGSKEAIDAIHLSIYKCETDISIQSYSMRHNINKPMYEFFDCTSNHIELHFPNYIFFKTFIAPLATYMKHISEPQTQVYHEKPHNTTRV